MFPSTCQSRVPSIKSLAASLQIAVIADISCYLHMFQMPLWKPQLVWKLVIFLRILTSFLIVFSYFFHVSEKYSIWKAAVICDIDYNASLSWFYHFPCYLFIFLWLIWFNLMWCCVGCDYLNVAACFFYLLSVQFWKILVWFDFRLICWNTALFFL